MTGYGINPINTFLMDITTVPRTLWNVWWRWYGLNPFNWLFDILNLLPNMISLLWVWIPFIWEAPIALIRWILGATRNESFFWGTILAGLLGWGL